MKRRGLLRKLTSKLVATVLLAAGLTVIAPATNAHADPGCQNGGVFPIWVRGTNEGFNAPEAQAFFSGITSNFGGFPHAGVELGNIDGDNNDQKHLDPGEYPASLGDYFNSRATGVTELVNYLNWRYRYAPEGMGCKREAPVLGGYSQGADVIGAALQDPRLDPAVYQQIAYVALFGDSRFNNGGLPNCLANAAANLVGIHRGWVRGNAWCLNMNAGTSFVAQGIWGARNPYIPDALSGRVGSWCNFSDPICTAEPFALFGLVPTAGLPTIAPSLGWLAKFQPHFHYGDSFIPEAVSEMTPQISAKIASLNSDQPPPPRTPVTSPPLDGQVIESTDGNYYAGAGGKLFWFDRSNTGLVNTFVGQMNQRWGNIPIPLMNAADVHLIEVNRDNSGNFAPGSHMPADGTVLLQVNDQTQYMIRAGRPFPIGSPAELVATGGQNQAVFVPSSVGDLQKAPTQGWPSGLIQFYGDPRVFTSNGDYVSSPDTRDCLKVTTGQDVTLLPGSAESSFPVSGNTASCNFPDNMFLVNQDNGQQLQMKYGAGMVISDPNEVIAQGGQDQAKPVSGTTFNNLVARTPSIANGTLVRPTFGTTVYQFWTDHWEPVSSIGQRDCLSSVNQRSVDIVPGSLIPRFPVGPIAKCILPHGRAFYDTGDNHQSVGQFGGFFPVAYSELSPMGLVGQAAAMSHDGMQFAEGQFQFVNVPANVILKAPGNDAIYESLGNNTIQHIGNPIDLEKFKTKDGQTVQLVTQSFIDWMSATGKILPGDAPISLENTLVLASDGVRVAYILGGQLHPVGNPAIRDCIKVRATARVSGAGAPLPASDYLWNSYPVGTNAHCNYEQEPGLNFVQEQGDSTVWLVHPDGTKQHVGSFCVGDPLTTSTKRFHLFFVPAGETARHRQTTDFWANPNLCAALPG